MHLQKDHVETDMCALQNFIKSNPLGLFTTSTPAPNSSASSLPLLEATHIPFLLDVEDDSNSLGKLRGHMARANPQAQTLIKALADSPANTLPQDVLVVFTSPVQHYITTNFYPETMSTHKRTAPTWNYSAAQVYGRATIHFDASLPRTKAFLMQQLRDLAVLGERDIMGFGDDAGGGPRPWTVDDAPEAYVQRSLKGIIGIEIEMVRLEGKVKMSQELKEADRAGVVEGLRALPSETARKMADLVHERGVMKMASKAC